MSLNLSVLTVQSTRSPSHFFSVNVPIETQQKKNELEVYVCLSACDFLTSLPCNEVLSFREDWCHSIELTQYQMLLIEWRTQSGKLSGFEERGITLSYHVTTFAMKTAAILLQASSSLANVRDKLPNLSSPSLSLLSRKSDVLLSHYHSSQKPSLLRENDNEGGGREEMFKYKEENGKFSNILWVV